MIDRSPIRAAGASARRNLRTKYAGRNRHRDFKLPPAAVTLEEWELVEQAARADGVSISYLVRAGALTEARKRLLRAGLI